VSQVAAKRKLNIRNEKVIVNGYFHEHGSVLKGDAEGFCDAFEIQVSIDSDEPASEIAELIRLARKMCFTEKALTGNVQLSVTNLVNGKPEEI
jgi:organic hydroperoxide reductase OsmC/OhrA